MYSNFGLRTLACDFGTACLIRTSKSFSVLFCFAFKTRAMPFLVKQIFVCLFELIGFFSKGFFSHSAVWTFLIRAFKALMQFLWFHYTWEERDNLWFSAVKLIKICNALKHFWGRIVVGSIETEHRVKQLSSLHRFKCDLNVLFFALSTFTMSPPCSGTVVFKLRCAWESPEELAPPSILVCTPQWFWSVDLAWGCAGQMIWMPWAADRTLIWKLHNVPF